MSAVETTPKALTKAMVSRLYNPFKEGIVTAAEALVAAEEKVTHSRVALGRIIGEAVAALTTGGASAEEAQARIMETVGTVTSSVEWQTVQGWVRSAVVYDSLPDTVDADSFSCEALKAIGQVKPDDRSTFVEVLADAKITNVRDIREAVTAHRSAEAELSGKPSRSAKGTAASAADAVKAGKRIQEKNPLPDRETDEEAWIVAVAMLAVDIRTKCPKFTRPAMVAAIEETIHGILFGDEEAADVV